MKTEVQNLKVGDKVRIRGGIATVTEIRPAQVSKNLLIVSFDNGFAADWRPFKKVEKV